MADGVIGRSGDTVASHAMEVFSSDHVAVPTQDLLTAEGVVMASQQKVNLAILMSVSAISTHVSNRERDCSY